MPKVKTWLRCTDVLVDRAEDRQGLPSDHHGKSEVPNDLLDPLGRRWASQPSKSNSGKAKLPDALASQRDPPLGSVESKPQAFNNGLCFGNLVNGKTPRLQDAPQAVKRLLHELTVNTTDEEIIDILSVNSPAFRNLTNPGPVLNAVRLRKAGLGGS